MGTTHQAQGKVGFSPNDQERGRHSRRFEDALRRADANQVFNAIINRHLTAMDEELRATCPDLLIARQLTEALCEPEEVARAWVAIACGSGDREDCYRALSAIRKLDRDERPKHWIKLARWSDFVDLAAEAYQQNYTDPNYRSDDPRYHIPCPVDEDQYRLDLLLAILERSPSGDIPVSEQWADDWDQAEQLIPRLELPTEELLPYYIRWYGVTNDVSFREQVEQMIEGWWLDEREPGLISLFAASGRLSDLHKALHVVCETHSDDAAALREQKQLELLLIAVERHRLHLVDDQEDEEELLEPEQSYKEVVSQLLSVLSNEENQVRALAALLGVRAQPHAFRRITRIIAELEHKHSNELDQLQLWLAQGCAQAGVNDKARRAADRISDLSPLFQIQARAAIVRAWYKKRAKAESEE